MTQFKNHWQIEGTLTTATNLHIGDGDTGERILEDENVLVSTIAIDYRNRPYIPGSTLKGCLRGWLEKTVIENKLQRLNQVFGTKEQKEQNARAGKAEFVNAYYKSNNIPACFPSGNVGSKVIDHLSNKKNILINAEHGLAFHKSIISAKKLKDEINKFGTDEKESAKAALDLWQKNFPPYYNFNFPYVGVGVSVAIDRPKRVASENMLAHLEYVPAGTSFDLVISGKNGEGDEIAFLIFLLNQFNCPENPIRLGANTINGWGEFTWKLDKIKAVNAAGVKDWFLHNNNKTGYNILDKVGKASYKKHAEHLADEFKNKLAPPRLRIGLTLKFSSPFLVNDPSITGKGQNISDHAPLLDKYGNAYLPSQSITGAFRSQAEKILRTLGNGEEDVYKKYACLCTSNKKNDKCEPIFTVKESKKLCLACQVFGTTGWQSTVAFSDFIAKEKPGTPLEQEFVAIDRFTGGGAKSLKFNAQSVYAPVFHGTVSIDIRRLSLAGAEIWSLGLLALTFRDLIEGDISLGYGAAKGYGQLTASIDTVVLSGSNSIENLCSLLSEYGLDEKAIKQCTVTEDIQLLLMDFIEEFSEKVNSLKKTGEISHA